MCDLRLELQTAHLAGDAHGEGLSDCLQCRLHRPYRALGAYGSCIVQPHYHPGRMEFPQSPES